jgi:hypothetical protein
MKHIRRFAFLAAFSLDSGVFATTTLSNPTGTSSTTGVMMGFGVTTCRFTPAYSARVQFIISGVVGNNATGNGSTINMRYGTGAGPANGTAIAGAGTAALNSKAPGGNSAGGSIQNFPFTMVALVTGLSPGTTYWFDASLAASASTSAITSADCAAHELMLALGWTAGLVWAERPTARVPQGGVVSLGSLTTGCGTPIEYVAQRRRAIHKRS